MTISWIYFIVIGRCFMLWFYIASKGYRLSRFLIVLCTMIIKNSRRFRCTPLVIGLFIIYCKFKSFLQSNKRSFIGALCNFNPPLFQPRLNLLSFTNLSSLILIKQLLFLLVQALENLSIEQRLLTNYLVILEYVLESRACFISCWPS